MFMLPSTNKVYRDTKRIHFSWWMDFIDWPIICICFEGLVGDFYKKLFFKDMNPNEDVTFLLRSWAVKGLW